MIIRGTELEATRGRKPYPIADRQTILHHLSVYQTGPENPFGPHKHERAEMWYIVDGEALVTIDGHEEGASAGDLILIDPWVEHGLRSATLAEWVCLG